jgi:hypothetical protein
MSFFTSSFVTFTVAMLLVSVLGGIYGHGRKRAFLGGFAIGAWGYFVISYGPYNLNTLGNELLTNEALEFVSTSWLGEPLRRWGPAKPISAVFWSSFRPKQSQFNTAFPRSSLAFAGR